MTYGLAGNPLGSVLAGGHRCDVAYRTVQNPDMTDAQFGSSGFKQRGDVPLTVGKAVGELKPIVRLATYASRCIENATLS